MIQLNTTYSTDIHPRHAMLHNRYRDFALSLSHDSHERLPSVATFVPSSGKVIAFDRPIAMVGSVLLTEFSHHTDPDDRLSTTGGCFQGYRARFLSHTAETLWEPEPWFSFPVSASTYATSSDERLMRSPRLLDTLLGLGQLSIRMSEVKDRDQWQLTLPYTLLGFHPDDDTLLDRLLAEPTPWVESHGQQYGLTIEQAFHELDAATRLEDDVAMTGLRLVDSRLCASYDLGTDHLPEVLTAFHDLRPLLGRRCMNPVRKLLEHEQQALSQAQDDPALAIRRLRKITPHHIAEGCSDRDLLAALRNPEGPLYASQIAKRQAW